MIGPSPNEVTAKPQLTILHRDKFQGKVIYERAAHFDALHIWALMIVKVIPKAHGMHIPKYTASMCISRIGLCRGASLPGCGCSSARSMLTHHVLSTGLDPQTPALLHETRYGNMFLLSHHLGGGGTMIKSSKKKK